MSKYNMLLVLKRNVLLSLFFLVPTTCFGPENDFLSGCDRSSSVLHHPWCINFFFKQNLLLNHLAKLGRVVQLVTCLATDASLTADPGVASSIPARSHTFVDIDHEIISTVILLPSAESFKKGCFVVSYKRKYVHKVLVNCLFKLAQEKVWLGELTVTP